jgi:hypothetical protein
VAVTRTGSPEHTAPLGRVVDSRVEVPPAPAAGRTRRKIVNAATVARALARPAPTRATGVGAYPKVFVVGCGRSGTSWVQDIIATSPQVATTQESHAYDSLYAPLVKAGVRRPEGWLKVLQRFDLSWREQRWVGLYWWVTRPELVAIMNEVLAQRQLDDRAAASAAVRGVLDRWFVAHRDGAEVLLEKTPGHIAFAAQILEAFPEARVVEVVRDGRDVCVSLEKQALTLSWPPTRREDQIRLWRRAVQRGQELHADPRWAARVRRVRYEDLHADPSGEVAALYEFLELDIDAATASQVVESTSITRFDDRTDGRHRRKGAVGEWRSTLDDADLELIDREAGELLRAVGYT